MLELVRGFERDRDSPPPLPTRGMSELLVDELPVVDLAKGADVLVIFPVGFTRVRIGAQPVVELVLNPLPEPDQAPLDGDG